MSNKQEIETAYKTEHDRITKAYYQEHALSEADFKIQHTAIGQKLLNDLASIGQYTPPPKPIAWAAKYAACKTDTERIAILCQRLGMAPQI